LFKDDVIDVYFSVTRKHATNVGNV